MQSLSFTALALFCLAPSACGSSDDIQPCYTSCPATYVDAVVGVNIAPATAGDVQATLTGPVTATMSCQANGDATLCRWPASLPVMAGAYSLQVSAPGYQPATVPAQINVSALRCGCSEATIQPSTVSLTASGSK